MTCRLVASGGAACYFCGPPFVSCGRQFSVRFHWSPPPLFQQQATVRRLQELYEHTAGEVIEERNLRLDLEAQLDAYRNPRRYRALM